MFDTLLKPEKKIIDHAAPSVFYNEDRAASYLFYALYPVRMNHLARTGKHNKSTGPKNQKKWTRQSPNTFPA